MVVVKQARVIALALGVVALLCGGASADRVRGTVEAGDVRFDELDSRPVQAGQCGMYVWAHGDQPVLMLIAYDNPAEAVVRPRGRERTLQRTAFEGERVHGHFERQTFTGRGLTLTLDVTLSQPGELRDGARIERGVIRLVDREGWETVVPVGGLVACVH